MTDFEVEFDVDGEKQKFIPLDKAADFAHERLRMRSQDTIDNAIDREVSTAKIESQKTITELSSQVETLNGQLNDMKTKGGSKDSQMDGLLGKIAALEKRAENETGLRIQAERQSALNQSDNDILRGLEGVKVTDKDIAMPYVKQFRKLAEDGTVFYEKDGATTDLDSIVKEIPSKYPNMVGSGRVPGAGGGGDNPADPTTKLDAIKDWKDLTKDPKLMAAMFQHDPEKYERLKEEAQQNRRM